MFTYWLFGSDKYGEPEAGDISCLVVPFIASSVIYNTAISTWPPHRTAITTVKIAMHDALAPVS